MSVNSLQGWQLLTPKETSFFAAVNLPMLDFHSRTGPEADFNSGMLLFIAESTGEVAHHHCAVSCQ